MAVLRAPHLGPIVGHTTPTSCRIWIRGKDPADGDGNLDSERRTIGVGVVYRDNTSVGQPFYFRLHRGFDRTGTFNIGVDDCISGARIPPLTPDTGYRVKVGVLSIDDPYNNLAMVEDDVVRNLLPSPATWVGALEELKEKKAEAKFHTFPRSGNKFGFMLGSCRYPGLFWNVKRSDRIFGAVGDEADRTRVGSTPRFILMAGDQIYADRAHRLIPIGRADTFKEFQERYHTALGSPNMRKLLRKLPTYMILDDHEIEDNWSRNRLRREGDHRLFTTAIEAYLSYQWSHGPRSFGTRTYYEFECSGYPFFVLDTRTNRYYDHDDDTLENNHLLGHPNPDPDNPSQLNRFLDWLAAQPQKKPKFVVSPSVFVPNPVWAIDSSTPAKKRESDSWPGFPNARRAILKLIVDKKIDNVVFLSGDIHCSNVASMEFERGGVKLPLKAFSVTSSAFYWPFCFADGDPSEFVHSSRKKETWDPFDIEPTKKPAEKTVMHYTAQNFTQEDNFTRLDVHRDAGQLVVRVFDGKGEPVKKKSRRKLEAKLALNPW